MGKIVLTLIRKQYELENVGWTDKDLGDVLYPQFCPWLMRHPWAAPVPSVLCSLCVWLVFSALVPSALRFLSSQSFLQFIRGLLQNWHTGAALEFTSMV